MNYHEVYKAGIEKAKAAVRYLGGEPLSEARFVEMIEQRETCGVPMSQLVEELEEYREKLIEFRAGVLKPSKVGGRGTCPKKALEWIEKQIRLREIVIEEGNLLLYGSNASNYSTMLWEQFVALNVPRRALPF